MEHFVGLDVSVRETSVCVVDGAGKLVYAPVPAGSEVMVGATDLGHGHRSGTRPQGWGRAAGTHAMPAACEALLPSVP